MAYKFYCDCVSWPRNDVTCDGGLSDMIDNAINITRQTFLKHVHKSDLEMLADAFGYAKHPMQGLTMVGDWAVSYHKSKLHDKRVYYFVNSAIEYVFVK